MRSSPVTKQLRGIEFDDIQQCALRCPLHHRFLLPVSPRWFFWLAQEAEERHCHRSRLNEYFIRFRTDRRERIVCLYPDDHAAVHEYLWPKAEVAPRCPRENGLTLRKLKTVKTLADLSDCGRG
jgi:hypothetical protein